MVFRTSTRRQAALAAIPTALVVAGLLFSAAPDARAQATATPAAMGVLEQAAGLPECAPSEIGSLPRGTQAAAIYALVPEESTARYRVQEELAQVGKTEAVGETRAVIGQIAFDADGKPVPCSRIDVDLRTLQSDEAKQDNYLYRNTLEAATYPLATFVLRDVQGLDASLADGQETPLTLIGDLTVHGVTKPVAWEATATRDSDTLTGTAATEFEMPAFGIEPPSVPVVLSLDETVRLEIDLTARVG